MMHEALRGTGAPAPNRRVAPRDEAGPAADTVAPAPRRPRRGRLRPGWLLLAALVGLVGWFGLRVRADLAAAVTRADALVATQSEALASIPPLTEEERTQLRRSRNPVHLERAEALGVTPLPDRGAFETGLLRDSLTEVRSGDRYVVRTMRYGVPYLTADAAAVLDSVGARFADRLAEHGAPPFRVTLTSALRTADDQARLRRVNVNAARDRSSHEFGTTFDLTYRRFAPAPLGDALPPDLLPDAWWLRGLAEPLVREHLADGRARLAETQPERLAAALGRTLIDLENDGLLLVVRERRQPVFHVTVAQRLAE